MLRSAVLALLSLAATVALAAADAQQPPTPIRFARGAETAEVRGSIVRGEVRRYSLAARAGQRMRVEIRSLEDNAVFQLYPPRSERPAAGAREGEDARSWKGRLPATGSYLLVVGSTRGNASYTLRVLIR